MKGLEVPYIYDRLGRGLTEEESMPMVMRIIRGALGYTEEDEKNGKD